MIERAIVISLAAGFIIGVIVHVTGELWDRREVRPRPERVCLRCGLLESHHREMPGAGFLQPCPLFIALPTIALPSAWKARRGRLIGA